MPRPKKQVNFYTHTKTNLILTHTLKPSQFRPAHSQFRPPPQKKKVNFDPCTKTNAISISTQKPTQKPSEFWSRHWNQVIFGPHTKKKVNSHPYSEIKSI